MSGVISRVRGRIYGDFLMGSRLGLYRELLVSALASDYRITSVGGVWHHIKNGGLDPAERYLVLRHDVDTDPRTAAAMWEVDRGLGIRSSYFFRLSTLAPELMADIDDAGGEASYHYEELATVAKRRRLRSRPDALRHVPEARDLFAENIMRLRTQTGLTMSVVASHGDFVNRGLGLANWVILADPAFRSAAGIELETYDESLLRHLPSRHTDAPHPTFWEPREPAAAIREGEPVVSVLVHPRHWRVDRVVNARDDLRRLLEGVSYQLPTRAGPWT